MFGAFSKEQQLRSFLRAKERVCKEAAEGAVWGWQVETRAEGGSRSPSRTPGHRAWGVQVALPLLCLTFPSEGRTRFIAWESGEPFVGSHCFQEGVQRLRWAYPSWCHSQAAPARTQPSPPAPPRLPGRSTPPRPSLLAPPPALYAGLRGSRTIASPRHRPRPQAGSPESSPSSSPTPPFLLLPARSPVGSPAVCASVSGPFPAPRLCPAPASQQADLPARRPAPSPGQGPGRAEPPRQCRASSPCA